MQDSQLATISNFIWNIADTVASPEESRVFSFPSTMTALLDVGKPLDERGDRLHVPFQPEGPADDNVHQPKNHREVEHPDADHERPQDDSTNNRTAVPTSSGQHDGPHIRSSGVEEKRTFCTSQDSSMGKGWIWGIRTDRTGTSSINTGYT